MSNDARPNSSYYKLLNRKIVLIIVAVSVIPLILITATISYYFQASYTGKVSEHLKILVRKHRQNIDSFLVERLRDISDLAYSYPVDRLSDEIFLRERLGFLQRQHGPDFVDIGLVDENGIQVSYAGPFAFSKVNYSDAPWFKQAMQKEEYISDVFPGLRGAPHFIIAVKKRDLNQNWLLRATVDFEKFNQLVEGIRVGETGFAFIMNSKGEFQTRPRPEALPFRDYYKKLVTESHRLDEQTGIIKSTSFGAPDFLYVSAALGYTDWILVFQQSESDAHSALYSARRITLLIFLLGVFSIIAVAIILSRGLIKRIWEADQQKELMNEKVIEAGKLASVGELAAGIAHEINNPVAVMVEEAGWMQDLLDEDETESENKEEFRRSLNQIKLQGARCKQITHKLLSFARKTDPIPKKVDLNDVVNEAVALCGQRTRGGAVKLETVLSDDLPTVRVSPTEAQQVFINLINNAIDAVEPKGGSIQVKTRQEGNYVVVDVEDDGPGIPAYVLPRIFDPFFTTKQVGKGTGLGLSICYGIMKKIDGDITINTAEGSGTQFHVKFPLPKGKKKVDPKDEEVNKVG